MHDVVYFQLKMNHSSAKSWSFHGFSFQMKIENQEKWAKLVTVFLQLNALVIFLKVNQKLVLSNSIMTCYRTFRDTKNFFHSLSIFLVCNEFRSQHSRDTPRKQQVYRTLRARPGYLNVLRTFDSGSVSRRYELYFVEVFYFLENVIFRSPCLKVTEIITYKFDGYFEVTPQKNFKRMINLGISK